MTKTFKILLVASTLLIFVLFLLISDQPSDIFQPAQIGPGTTYYVDGQLTEDCLGNYSIIDRACSGMDGYAYNTVQEGIDAAEDGNVIEIRQGTYQEIWQSNDSYEACFKINKDLTLRAYNPGTGAESVILTYDPNDYPITGPGRADCHPFKYGPIIMIDHDKNVTLEDLEIVGYLDKGMSETHEVCIYGGEGINQTLTVRRCIIRNCMHAGIKGKSQMFLYNNEIYDIKVPPDYSRPDGCYDKNDNTHAIYVSDYEPGNSANNGRIVGNYIHDIGDPNNPKRTGPVLQFRGTNSTGWEFYHNIVVVNQGKTNAVLLSGSDIKFHNNIIYKTSPKTLRNGLLFFHEHAYDIDYQNNIIWGFTYNVTYDSYSTGAGITHDYNVIENIHEGGTSGRYLFGPPEPNGFEGQDPGFISPSPSTWADFRLKDTSSLLNQGNNLGDNYKMAFDPNDTTWPPTLVDQNAQGNGWEIGAFVYQEGPPVNNPPVLSSIGDRTVTEGNALFFAISATDPNGDALTYLASNLPSGASFNPSTRTFSWTPSDTQSGSYSTTFTVSDGSLTDSETITITVTEDTPLPDLVLHYDMETLTGDGRIEDLSGSGNHGTIHDANWTSDGKYGGAYEFDGVDDYIDAGNDSSFNISEEITIALWAKIKDWDAVNRPWFVSKKHTAYEFGHQPTGGIGRLVSYMTIDGSVREINTPVNSVSLNTWFHAVMTYESGDWRIYIDGVLNTQVLSFTGAIATNSNNLEIARRSGSAVGDHISGLIDDVRIYARALTATEIQALYEGTPPSDTTPPAAPTGVGVE